MSVQFGRWNFDGKPVDRDYLEKVKASLAPYGPDHAGSYSKDNVSILYHAFHTTKESRRETQPHVTESGAILTWDGRLDNRADLIHHLSDVLTVASTDVEIVTAAYESWLEGCFARLIGDWAISIWNPSTRSLVLAKDPLGTRHLYYSFDNEHVAWSSILDPLVLLARKTFKISEEYIAGWLSFNPAAHLTPYVGIHSVPPSCSVLVRRGWHTVRKYWDFDPEKRIHYGRDAEYEEHFRTVFGEAVRRRLRSDSPILAELSGGMDSSSIVCMADTIIAGGALETSRLDTISCYDDSDSSWNERPYFTKVEEKLGRTGCHVDAASQQMFIFDLENGLFEPTPVCAASHLDGVAKQFISCVQSHGNRVVLSGVGGDEVMGGVPTATPQLQDLFAEVRFRELARQLKVWALSTRKPWFHLLVEAIREFLPVALVGASKFRQPATWLNPSFIRRNRLALAGYPERLRFFGSRPTFQATMSTLDALRRQLACKTSAQKPPYEKRYPYLDLSLLEFVFSIPREQLIRAGQRRSLMRRALVGIVPNEILNRKRKAFVARRPRTAISAQWASLLALSQHMSSSSLGIVHQDRFIESLQNAKNNNKVPLVLLMRTILLEVWLRTLLNHGSLFETCRGSLDLRDCLKSSVISAEHN
jgi:asparagine synthase (glutamine-hydrolysing)